MGERKIGMNPDFEYTYFIDIVGACNIGCPSCPTVDKKYVGRPRGVMSVEMVDQILTKIKKESPAHISKTRICIFQWGEPTIHPQAGEIVRLVKKHGFYCMASSNLNREDHLEDMVRSQIDCIKVSLSGFYQDTYVRAHERGNVDVVKANMYLLKHYKEKYNPRLNIWVGYHMYKYNIGEDCLKMQEMCVDLGFGFLPNIGILHPFEKMIDYYYGKVTERDQKVIDTLLFDPKEFIEICVKNAKDENKCGHRDGHMVINVDGSVSTCCGTYDPNTTFVVKNFLNIPDKELYQKKLDHDFCKTCIKHGLNLEMTGIMPESLQQHLLSITNSIPKTLTVNLGETTENKFKRVLKVNKQLSGDVLTCEPEYTYENEDIDWNHNELGKDLNQIDVAKIRTKIL